MPIYTPQDAQISAQNETVFGVLNSGLWATVKSYAFISESLDFTKNVKQDAGLRSGYRVARSPRRYVPTAEGTGDISLELQDKVLGQFLQAAFGLASSTGITGVSGGFQQMFTIGNTSTNGPALRPSMSIQKVIPNVIAQTLDQVTLLGATIDNFSFAFPNADFATAKFTINAKDVNTSAIYAGAPIYTVSPTLFHFGQANVQICTLSNLIVPTATTPTPVTGLAQVASPIGNVNIRSAEIQVDCKADQARYNLGGGGRKSQPVAGMWDIKGKFTAEYTTTYFRDAYLNETPFSLVLTYTTPTLLSGTTFTTMQLVLPEVKLDSAVPQVNGTDLVTTDFNFSVLDPLSGTIQPIYFVLYTSDPAL